MPQSSTERVTRHRARQRAGRTQVSTELDADDLAWLDAETQRRQVSRSEVLRLLVGAQRRASTVDGKIGIRAPNLTAASHAENMTRHPFKPQKHNGLRCEHCGQRKAAH